MRIKEADQHRGAFSRFRDRRFSQEFERRYLKGVFKAGF